jgi:hypothetical protein
VSSFVAGSCEHGVLHPDRGIGAEVAGGHLVLALPAASVAFATGMAARRASCACGIGEAFEC